MRHGPRLPRPLFFCLVLLLAAWIGKHMRTHRTACAPASTCICSLTGVFVLFALPSLRTTTVDHGPISRDDAAPSNDLVITDLGRDLGSGAAAQLGELVKVCAPYYAAPRHAAPRHAAPRRTTPHRTVPCSAMLCPAVRCHAVPTPAPRCLVLLYALPCPALRSPTIVPWLCGLRLRGSSGLRGLRGLDGPLASLPCCTEPSRTCLLILPVPFAYCATPCGVMSCRGVSCRARPWCGVPSHAAPYRAEPSRA